MDAQNPAVQQKKSSGLAITALVLGILSLILGFLTAIPGIITGHMARSRAKKNPQQYGGAGMALTGLIISYAVIILSIVSVYLLATNPEMKEMLNQIMQQSQQAVPAQ